MAPNKSSSYFSLLQTERQAEIATGTHAQRRRRVGIPGRSVAIEQRSATSSWMRWKRFSSGRTIRTWVRERSWRNDVHLLTPEYRYMTTLLRPKAEMNNVKIHRYKK